LEKNRRARVTAATFSFDASTSSALRVWDMTQKAKGNINIVIQARKKLTRNLYIACFMHLPNNILEGCR